MIGTIISAILWFLLGVIFAIVATIKFILWSYNELGGEDMSEETKKDVADEGFEVYKKINGFFNK